MKLFVKVVDREDSGFAFPWISMEKFKAGIFDHSQIRKVIKYFV